MLMRPQPQQKPTTKAPAAHGRGRRVPMVGGDDSHRSYAALAGIFTSPTVFWSKLKGGTSLLFRRISLSIQGKLTTSPKMAKNEIPPR